MRSGWTEQAEPWDAPAPILLWIGRLEPHKGVRRFIDLCDRIDDVLPMLIGGTNDTNEEVMDTVDRELGAIGRPGQVHFVTLLPKTRSGKLLRRSIQALAEGRDPGDLTTIEDPGALEQIRRALAESR